MSTMTMSEAVAAWSKGNNDGRGYAPYTDVAGDDTVEAAIEAATNDGWELVLPRGTSDEIAVLRNGDGETMGIGDSNGAWAVILSDAQG